MSISNAPLPVTDRSESAARSLPAMTRKDRWWVQPLLIFIGFTAFIIYTTWRAFENQYFQFGSYLSPFYSPDFTSLTRNWIFAGKHFSPALLILPVPLLFRGTCYYYRKAYYRSYFLDPPGCAVPEPLKRPQYTGERAFPWVLQNIHRYAFYLAAIVMLVLWWDAIAAFSFDHYFGIGLGSIIFLVNVVLLSLYTFSCHSWRHLSGGCTNCFSCSATAKTRYSLWERVTHLNEFHHIWAWCSLFSVLVTDLYVRCLATNVMSDPHFITTGLRFL